MIRASVLERERELPELSALAADVGDGVGGTVVVEGQPGLGKSTLLARAARQARRRGGIVTLEFCCGELEQELAWEAARGLMSRALQELAPATVEHRLAGPAATLLDHAWSSTAAGTRRCSQPFTRCSP